MLAGLKARGIDVIAVAEAKKDEVKSMVRRFTTMRSAILVISYETFRIHQNMFKKGNQCGLLICDEAHRLKNKETKTAIALSALQTRRRVLLSGTPIQNVRQLVSIRRHLWTIPSPASPCLLT